MNINKSITYILTAATIVLASCELDYAPENTGMFDVALRIFPSNDKLEHRMDFALVKWA